MESNENFGIWGNTSCQQCGACCSEYIARLTMIMDWDHACNNFVIEDGKARCLVHEDPNRDPICQAYFCGNRREDSDPVEIKYGHERMRALARKLGTAPLEPDKS